MKNKRLPKLLLLLVFALCAPTINGQLYKFFGDLVTFLINLTRLQSFIIPLYPDLNIPGPADHYDFIIIGSGPSGSTLANRLTENSSIRVLLLENGEEASIVTDIPIIAGALGPSKYNYGYKTEPQEGFCRGCIDKRIFWEHGNALGGSSIINYMLYVRGNKRDYDKWRDLGNPGWGYDDLLPLFKKIEDCQVAYTDPGYRATGGYLTVSDVAYRTKLSGAYVQACLEAGMRYVDYNGAEQLGVSYIQATTRTGQRCSAEKAYLRPVHTRPNLTIKTNAKVTKIILDSNNVAQGVEYYKLGIKYKAYADKEVISSAGALNTPQLLMLSGIGPKDHLEKLGINVIKSLPVGQKMYDHATFPVIVFQVNDSIVINSIAEALNPINYVEYPFGKGILTSPGGVEVMTFVKVNISTEPDPMWPDIELLVLGGALSSDGGTIFRKMFNISPKIYDKVFKPLENKYVYQATPVLLHPRSYGWMELNSSNPFDAPLFYANYFSDPDNFDIKMMIAGIREFERINESPALQKYNSTIVSIPVPGCETEQFDSDAYWECAIRTVIGSYYHQVATCKMGPITDTEAVVDNQLRVYGIKKLRVVDTSVIPFPPTAHNVAPGYVIGEKAAQLVKKTWNI